MSPQDPATNQSDPEDNRNASSTAVRRRRRRRITPDRRTRKSGNKFFARWIALVLILCGMVLVALLISSLLPKEKQDREPRATKDAEGIIQPPPLDTDQAKKMVNALYSATSADEMEKLIAPGEIGPDQAVKLVASLTWPDSYYWFGPLKSSLLPLEAIMSLPTSAMPRIVLFRPGPDGQWVIDFDAFMIHSDPPFSKMASGEIKSGRFRVIASPDHFFHGNFGDDEEWVCFSLSIPFSRDRVFGYCRRDGPQAAAMREIELQVMQRRVAMGSGNLPAGDKSARVILDLARPPGSRPNQVEIKAVVADDWALGDIFLDSGKSLASPQPDSE